MRRFVYIDPLECFGCRYCEVICSSVKEKVVNPRKSRIKVVHKSPLTDLAIACRHCTNPPCAEVCPTNAIIKKADIVTVDRDKCIGCAFCVDACPFGAMNIHPDKGYAYNCDLCGACTKYCPADCLKIVTPDLISQKKAINIARIYQDQILKRVSGEVKE
jgi:carbon-monoxide dehydrogenase iron sulfur subunit